MKDFQGSPRFAVRRRIGEGGMGVVYEAFDRERGTEIALKTLRDVEGAALYRFKKEFRSLANIAHPNLISLYELHSITDSWFFTMELIRGCNFLRWVRPARPLETRSDPNVTIVDEEATLIPSDQEEGEETLDDNRPKRLAPLDLDRLRAALGQMVRGVHALHAAGRLHRDLKPTNVMVTDEARVVILDFGLVAELERDKEFQSTLKHVVGTAGYMSPEQARGEGIGPASDWYAVGAMLFEALVGRRPFVGRPMEVLIEKQTKAPPRPRDFDPSIPEDLDQLAVRLLATHAKDRVAGPEVLERLGVPEVRAETADLADPRPELIGRDRELALLRSAFERVKKGSAMTVLVSGASGTGKSALVRSFLSELTHLRDAVVLVGSCYEREAVPFKAFDQLIDGLSRFLRSLIPTDVDAVLPNHVDALARVFPVLRQVRSIQDAVLHATMRITDLRSSATIDLAEVRGRAFRALRRLLVSICARLPVVLAIDDLQWGDEDSAELLREILREPDPPPLLFIASYRAEDRETPPIRSMLGAVLESSTSTCTIDLLPLNREESRALAQLLLGGVEDEVAERIAVESGGSPYFITELVLLDRISSADELTLDKVIAARIDALPQSARRLLEIVSVAGGPLATNVAVDAAGLGKDQEQALSLLLARNLARTVLVGDAAPELAPYHERIRRAALAKMSAEAVAAAHRALAVALELLPNPDPELLAKQLFGSGDLLRGAEFALMAARQAKSNLALERSVALYQRALPVLRTHELEREAVEVFAEAGRGLEAAELYHALSKATTGEESTAFLRMAAEQLLKTGHIGGVQLLEEVLSRFGMSLSKSAVGRIAQLATARLRVRLRGLHFDRRSASKIDPLQLDKVDAIGSVATGLGMVDAVSASHFQSRHLLAALDAGEPHRIVRALAMEACYSAAFGSSNRRRTQTLVDETERLAKSLPDDPKARGLALMARGAAAFLGGRFAEGERASREAEETFRGSCRGVQWEIATVGIFHLMSLAMLGRVAELNRYVRRNVRDALRRGDRYAAANLRSGHGNLAWLVGGDPDGAEKVLDQTAAHLPKGFTMPHAYEVIARGNFFLYRREARRAYELFTSKRSAFERSLVPRVQFLRIETIFLFGRCALAAGDTKAAEQLSIALSREEVGFAPALGRLLTAGIDEARRFERAPTSYARAARALADADLALHAAAAQRRQGFLTGDGALLEQAERWLCQQGLKDPGRFADVFAPPPFGG